MLGRLSQHAGVTELELVDYDGELSLLGTLALWDELTLDLPLVDGVQLVLGQPGLNLTALPFELDFGPPTGEVTGGLASWRWTRSSRVARVRTSSSCPRSTSACASTPRSSGRCVPKKPRTPFLSSCAPVTSSVHARERRVQWRRALRFLHVR